MAKKPPKGMMEMTESTVGSYSKKTPTKKPAAKKAAPKGFKMFRRKTP